MNIDMTKKALAVCLVVLAGNGFGADGSYSPVANLTEKWVDDAQWTASREGFPSVLNESMALGFSAQEPPIPKIGGLKASSLSSGGRFVGNYDASAIDYASFDVMRVGLASIAQLRFIGKSGKTWSFSFPLPQEEGVWEPRKIPMTYSDGWKAVSTNGAAAFAEDRTDIKSLEVRVSTTGTSAQEVRIDNFKLIGPWENGPMTADEMPLYWLMENGIPAQDGQAGLDADKDGLNNYAEYLAGSDPNSASSQFKVSIELGEDGKPILVWDRSDYRVYKVFKSSDLTGEGGFALDTGAIQTVGQQNRVSIEDQSSGQNYYRVKVEKQ